MRVVGLGGVLVLAVVAHLSGQSVEDFDRELNKIVRLTEKASWKKAKNRLDQLLAENEHPDWARQRQREIIGLATICAFQLNHPDPEALEIVFPAETYGDLESDWKSYLKKLTKD